LLHSKHFYPRLPDSNPQWPKWTAEGDKQMTLDISRRRALTVGTTLTAAALAGAISRPLRAETWPSKPIRFLVGFPPGGFADNYARAMSEHFAARLGQPVVVENRAGVVGQVALTALTQAAPDGYTICLVPPSTYWQSRVLFKKLPFDPDRDIAVVTFLSGGPAIQAVAESHPARNMREFIEWSRTRRASWGTFGPGSSAHLYAETLNRSEGASMTPIHYKGEAAVWVDVVGGVINVGSTTFSSFAALYERGGLRPISVSGPRRCPRLPDVPTLVEQGFTEPLLGLEAWSSIVAPANTPEPLLARLAELSVEWAGTPSGKRFLDQYGIPRSPTTREETRQYASSDAPIWIETVRSLGLPPM
jgi:tripartite-type tricarboxylate transporter receptor subunit TctC